MFVAIILPPFILLLQLAIGYLWIHVLYKNVGRLLNNTGEHHTALLLGGMVLVSSTSGIAL